MLERKRERRRPIVRITFVLFILAILAICSYVFAYWHSWTLPRVAKKESDARSAVIQGMATATAEARLHDLGFSGPFIEKEGKMFEWSTPVFGGRVWVQSQGVAVIMSEQGGVVTSVHVWRTYAAL
jgi:hypothetical protein